MAKRLSRILTSLFGFILAGSIVLGLTELLRIPFKMAGMKDSTAFTCAYLVQGFIVFGGLAYLAKRVMRSGRHPTDDDPV